MSQLALINKRSRCRLGKEKEVLSGECRKGVQLKAKANSRERGRRSERMDGERAGSIPALHAGTLCILVAAHFENLESSGECRRNYKITIWSRVRSPQEPCPGHTGPVL